MKIYSEKFHDEMEVREPEYKDFLKEVQNATFYDADLIEELIYYIEDTFFPKRANKIRIKRSTLLKKILYALDFITIEDIILLKGHELLEVVNSQNPMAIFLLYA